MKFLGREHHNLRVAFDWACTKGMREEALRLAGSLVTYWLGHGDWVEGSRCIDTALALPSEDLVTHTQQRSVAKILYAAGLFTWHRSDYDRARGYAEESLSHFEQVADEYGRAQAFHLLGLTARAQRDFAQATQRFSAALHLAHKCEDKLLIAAILSDMGAVCWRQHDFIKASELYEESLAYYQAEQDAHGVATNILSLGLVACWQGDLERAAPLANAA